MSDELREKVAEELWQAESLRVMGCRRSVPWSEAGPAAHNQWRPLADAAIALIRADTLEEAAKVADDLSDRWTKEWRAGLKADSRLEALSDGADDVAFAIRALKTQTTT